MELEMKSRKLLMKRRLWEWGGAEEKSIRKKEELKKILRQQEEQKERWKEDGEPLRETMRLMEMKAGGDIERLRGEIEDLLQEKAAMDRMLLALTEEEQWFVQMRFEKGYVFDYIGMKMHISRATLFRMQDRILKKLMEMKVETL